MTTRKITLSLPESLIEAAEAAVATGRARSVSAYVAAAAGAGEARLSLAEVMQRWQAEAEETSPEQVREAEEWAAGLMARSDQRYARRQAGSSGRAA
jgi:Arc/MetJ-type ribon-helix-helix transcriptional regulator